MAIRGLHRAEHRPARRGYRELRPLHFVQGQTEHGLQHRDIDVLTPARRLPLIQRCRDRAERINAGDHVCMIDTTVVRPRPPRLVRQVGHVVAGRRMDHGRIGRQFGRRTGLAVSRNRAIDQLRLERLQRGVVELEPPHDTRTEILDKNIRGRDQAANDLRRLRSLQVEHQTLLAGVELTEHAAAAVANGRAAPHRLTLGRLDLDDLRPHVRQHPRTMRAGDRGRKIQHAEAMETPGTLMVFRCGHAVSPPPPNRRPVTLDGEAGSGKRFSRTGKPASTALDRCCKTKRELRIDAIRSVPVPDFPHSASRRVSGITSQIMARPSAAMPARPVNATLLPNLSLT